MAKSIRCVFEYDLKFDRFKSEYNKNLRLEDKLYFLNEALDTIFRRKVNKFSESSSQYKNELRYFEVKEYELDLVKKEDFYSIYKLPDNYYKLLRQRSIQVKEGCGKKDIELISFETDDLNKALKNPFWKPSFEWEHSICDEGSEGLYVWYDTESDIDSIIVDYYRKPEEIHAPSLHPNKEYISWNGELITKDTTLELRDNLSNVVDLAILNTRASLGDVKDYELQLNKILNTEKIN